MYPLGENKMTAFVNLVAATCSELQQARKYKKVSLSKCVIEKNEREKSGPGWLVRAEIVKFKYSFNKSRADYSRSGLKIVS
jgi:hypothetical protein